jgi:hypothetical protein
MRKALLVLGLIFILADMQAQIAINTNAAAPNASAMLDISSTNKGMLIPRMSSAQRTAIVSPANGLMVYDTDTKSFWFYDASEWTLVGGGSTPFKLPYDTIVNQLPAAFKITNDGAGASIHGHSKSLFGVGIRATSDGFGGLALSAVTTRPGSNSILAYSDSGAIIKAYNNYWGNTNTAFDLLNKGQGITMDIKTESPGSFMPTLKMTTNSIGAGIEIYQTNQNSGARGISIDNDGLGPGVFAESKGGNAIWGVTKSISSAGVVGDNTFGEAVVGRSKVDVSGAIVGRNDSTGAGVRGFSTKNGIGVWGQSGVSGGTGVAGRFENKSETNNTRIFDILSNGGGTLLYLNATNIAGPPNMILVNNAGTGNHALFQTDGVNKARISNGGGGYFNGGTFNNGADVAEVFEVAGNKQQYEPGDVLVISIDKDRAVEKSSGPYSTLVAGVYATKPGVTLSENNIDSLISDNEVPMGVIGVIPTKVCSEGGAIKRGDLLVTSSTPGIAMKADINKVKVGQVIGKALENFNSASPGRIRVLVSIK